MRTTICRSCGASIVWIQTERGKAMPCDASPVYYKETKGGKNKIVTPNGATVCCEIVTEPEKADGFGYIPHWSTCNNPEKFKKGART